MFIGRREDGTIYGTWTVKQADDADHPRQEEVPDDHPEVVAFLTRPLRKPQTLAEQLVADDAGMTALKEEFDRRARTP